MRRFLGVGLLLATTVACSGPRARPRRPASPGRVAVERVGGRWRISSTTVELEVEGRGKRAGRIRRLDLVGNPAPILRYLAFALEVDGILYEPGEVSVRSVDRERRPALRIESTVDAIGRALKMATEVELDPAVPMVILRTRVETTSHVGRVRVADVVDWAGLPAFIPGVGSVSEEGADDVPWAARDGPLVTCALVPRTGGLDLRVTPDAESPAEFTLLGRSILPGPGVYERRLVLANGSPAAVAALAWSAAGRAARVVRGQITGPVQGAEVTALDEDGKIEAVATPNADGSFVLSVRPGRYRIEAGSSSGRATANVEAGEDTDVELDIPEGGRLRLSVSDASGAAIPARAVVTGVPPTRDPVLGPNYRADGAKQSVCLWNGTAEVALGVGRYRVTATHGPEWSIDAREVEVSEGETARVDLVLRHEVETPGWSAGDFHIHASPSPDSFVTLEDRVRSLLCEGIEIAVPTDHNRVTDYAPSIANLHAGDRIGTAPGVEVTTAGTRFGHFNAYPIDRRRGPMPFPFMDTCPAAIFGSMRAQYPDAVVQVNHPNAGPRQYFPAMGLDPATGHASNPAWSADFDALEVWNGIHLNRPRVVERNLVEWMDLLKAGLRYTAMGNSDSHRVHWHWVGYPRSYLRVPSDSPGAIRPGDIAAAVKGGHVFVTNGPILDLAVEGEGPGATVHADGGTVSVRVRLQAADWIETNRVEVWVGGELREHFRVEDPDAPGLRGEWSIDVPVQPPTFVVAIARGDRPLDAVQPGRSGPPLAFTNPVFVQ